MPVFHRTSLSLTPSLFRRTSTLHAGNLKLYKDKVTLYGKLIKTVNTFKNVTMAKYTKAQERLQNRERSLGVTAKIFRDAAFSGPITPNENVLQLVVTTNRGTCGAMNARMVQHSLALRDSGYKIRNFIVGRKGAGSFSSLMADTIAGNVIIDTDYDPVDAEPITQMIMTNDFDRLRVMYTRFMTVARQDWSELMIPSFERFEDHIRKSSGSGDTSGDVNNARLYNALNAMSSEQLKDFYIFHVQQAVNYSMLENNLSELAMRVVAVENQLTNITKLRAWALSVYNKTRQANITNELLELSASGAALELADLEEKEKAKKDLAQIISTEKRHELLARLTDDIHEQRMALARLETINEGDSKEAMQLRSRLEKYVKWRDLLTEDEQRPASTGLELHQFLRSFEDTYINERSSFALQSISNASSKGSSAYSVAGAA